MISPADGDLLQSYLDNQLTPVETAALQARLVREPALADALLLLSREEAVLREWAPTAVSPRTVLPLPVPPRRRIWRAALAGACAAAVLLVSLLLINWKQQPTPEPAAVAVAELEEVQGEVSVVTEKGEETALSGRSLFAGQELRTRGEDSFAVIRYADRARLELGADSWLRFLQKTGNERLGNVHITTGAVSAEIHDPETGAPMIFTTPHAEMQVKKSKFTFVSTPKATRVEAEEGKLALRALRATEPIELKGGFYAVATGEPTPMIPLSAPPLFQKPTLVLHEGAGPVLALVCTPDGNTIISGGNDGMLRTFDWPARTGTRPAWTVRALPRQVRSLSLSADGQLLACGGIDGLVQLWDVAELRERLTLRKLRGEVDALALSPDGLRVATSSTDNKQRQKPEMRVWNATTGDELHALIGQRGPVHCLAFSTDSKLLASGGKDGSIKLWDTTTWQEVRTLEGHARDVRCLAWSPDGRWLASGAEEGLIRLWSTENWQSLHTLEGHPRAVRSLAFDPASQRLLSSGNDPLVRLWSVRDGRERANLRGTKNNPVAFSPDGEWIFVAGADRSIKVWSRDTVEPRNPARVAPLLDFLAANSH
jgi:WD40 repeat protein/ferric-dicitrate binding protein FerR (iron transport regulator)